MLGFSKKLSKKFSELYSAQQLEATAKESGFMKRRTKLSPAMFLDTLLFNEFDNSMVSLNDHSFDLQLKHNVQVRKQSLHQRFNAESVKFVHTLLAQHLEQQINQTINTAALKCFSSVKIKDSTRFGIPPNLKDVYPGTGGSALAAGVHVQFEFNLKDGRVSDINPTDALRQDQADASETLEDIETGSLIIRDLGYFSTNVFQQISQRKAYFISRLHPRVNVYELKQGDYQLLDLKKVHSKMKQRGIDNMELEVFVGGKLKVPVRLFIELMPQDQVSKRMQRATRQASRKGDTLSKAYKTYASLNLFITNVGAEQLAGKHIRTLYRLRWQIELRFKCFKGLCKLHAIKKMNYYRFETYLYGCLLYILLNWEIAVNLISLSWKATGRMLSMYKCYKALKQSCHWLREALFNAGKGLHDYLQVLYSSIPNLLLEKRKEHLSQEEILLLKLEIK